VTILPAASVPLFADVLLRFAVSCAILAYGWACARRAVRARLGEAPWDIVALGAATLFALAITVPALLLGGFGWLNDVTWSLAALGAFTLLTLAPTTRDRVPARPGPAPSPPFSVALGGFLLGRTVFSMRNPPADWDSYHYHLPMIAEWMRTGHLGVPMHVPPPFGQYFPGNGELLETWMAWSTGRDTLVTWVGLAGLGLMALATRRLALLAGARAAIAESVALLVAAGPGVAQLTLGAKVDHLLAAWFAIGLVFATRYRAHRTGADLGLALCAVALLPGVKTTGPVYAAMVLAVALATSDWPERVAELPRHAGSLLAIVFAGGWWYVRNAMDTGNPLFPAGTVLGRLKLPGLLEQETLRRTLQLVVWLEGHAGHLTIPNVLKWFGPGAVAIALGCVLWPALKPSAIGGPTLGRRRATMFALLSMACAAFFLVTPFSGLYLPAVHGEPERVNLDNLRLLLPSLVLAAPVAAAGLSALGGEPIVAAVLVLVWIAGLGIRVAHVLPGIVVAGLLAWAADVTRRSGPLRTLARAATAAGFVLGISLAVASVDGLRERGEANAWNGFLARIQNMRWETLRDLRRQSDRHVVAIVGPASWWGLYGRDFKGRPRYVPVASPWSETDRPGRLLPERRDHPDHELWLANLRASGARFIVVSGLGDSCDVIPEQAWCRDDTARFVPVATARCAVAYRIVEPVTAPDSAAGGAR
jgi:hypothetical protein